VPDEGTNGRTAGHEEIVNHCKFIMIEKRLLLTTIVSYGSSTTARGVAPHNHSRGVDTALRLEMDLGSFPASESEAVLIAG
jgi:hypothetical protein